MKHLRELPTIRARRQVEIEGAVKYFGELRTAARFMKVHKGTTKTFELFCHKYECQYYLTTV